MTSRITRWRQ